MAIIAIGGGTQNSNPGKDDPVDYGAIMTDGEHDDLEETARGQGKKEENKWKDGAAAADGNDGHGIDSQ